MPNVTQTSAGVLIPVKANPKARRNAIDGVHDGRLKVSITAAPENGKANEAIRKLLCETLGRPKSAVSLHRGAKSQLKEFLVAETDIDTVRQQLQNQLGLER